MRYDDPGQASDEALATPFGDITDELARRGAEAFLLPLKATSNDALDELLAPASRIRRQVKVWWVVPQSEIRRN